MLMGHCRAGVPCIWPGLDFRHSGYDYHKFSVQSWYHFLISHFENTQINKQCDVCCREFRVQIFPELGLPTWPKGLERKGQGTLEGGNLY